MLRVDPNNISTVFHNRVSEIIDSQASSQFQIECSIMYADGTTIDLSAEYINRWSVHQRYTINYFDLVSIDLQIPVDTYRELVHNRQDLTMRIRLYGYKGEVIDPDQYIDTYEYQAIINAQEDPYYLLKSLTTLVLIYINKIKMSSL